MQRKGCMCQSMYVPTGVLTSETLSKRIVAPQFYDHSNSSSALHWFSLHCYVHFIDRVVCLCTNRAWSLHQCLLEGATMGLVWCSGAHLQFTCSSDQSIEPGLWPGWGSPEFFAISQGFAAEVHGSLPGYRCATIFSSSMNLNYSWCELELVSNITIYDIGIELWSTFLWRWLNNFPP